MVSDEFDDAYSLRTFAKKPAFAIVVFLTLALGIDANATIFNVTVCVSVMVPWLIYDHERPRRFPTSHA